MDKLTPEESTALKAWHAWLDDNRGDRARLRRADSPEDILLTDAFFHFLHRMDQVTPHWSQSTPMLTSACIAGGLAHVKADNTKILSKLLFGAKGNEKNTDELKKWRGLPSNWQHRRKVKAKLQ